MVVRFQPPQPEARPAYYLGKEGPFQTTTPAIGYATVEPIIDAVTSVISPTAIVGILAGVAAVAVTFVFVWWAARKVTRIIMGATRKGKLSV